LGWQNKTVIFHRTIRMKPLWVNRKNNHLDIYEEGLFSSRTSFCAGKFSQPVGYKYFKSCANRQQWVELAF
jgi:hypothetical protein